MMSECSIEKLERNIRSDKSTQDLAWHIYNYLVSYRTTCAALRQFYLMSAAQVVWYETK